MTLYDYPNYYLALEMGDAIDFFFNVTVMDVSGTVLPNRLVTANLNPSPQQGLPVPQYGNTSLPNITDFYNRNITEQYRNH